VGAAYPVEEIVCLPIMEPQMEQGKVRGIFEINDPNFGNLWSSIPLELFTQAGFNYGDRLLLTIRHAGEVVFAERVLFQQSFGFVARGEPIIYNNELMRIGLAVNQGSFCQQYGIGFGADWQVQFEK